MTRHVLVMWVPLVVLLTLAGCREPIEVIGTVSYQARIALPPDAVLEMQLADVSRTDIPPVILARQSYTGLGKPPFPFRLRPELRDLDSLATYAVQARMLVQGKLFMVNRRRATIDKANPLRPVEVKLDPVPRTVGE